MSSPSVSICMPAYNASGFIAEALESALAQTHQDFEIVVWDDASTDGTRDAVRSVRDSRIRLFGSSVNRGAAVSTNAALRLTRGQFIKFLHDDDVLEPECVERLLEVMASGEEVGLAFARRHLEDERPPGERREHEEPHWGLGALDTLNEGAALFDRYVTSDFTVNFIGEPSNVMVRRDRLARSGLFNAHVRQLMDVDLWLRIIHDCSVGFVDAKLSMYRYHGASLTNRIMSQGLQWLDKLWLLEGLATVPALWAEHPQLARRRAALRAQIPRDLAWLARTRRLRRHHLVDAARYSAYATREIAGSPPVIVEQL